jgi:hypothetical protein
MVIATTHSTDEAPVEEATEQVMPMGPLNASAEQFPLALRLPVDGGAGGLAAAADAEALGVGVPEGDG